MSLYGDKTYENLLNDALGRVSSAYDKRESSLVYNGMAPTMAELAQLYIGLDFVFLATYLLTAPREYLILRAADRGIAPSPASSAIFRAEFNTNIPNGERFTHDDLAFVVTARLPEDDSPTGLAHEVTCETPGTIANSYAGNLLPLNYIDGLTRAELIQLVIPGEDVEETEAFRTRVLNSLRSRAFGGNIEDYKEKTKEIPGVTAVKVHPVWNGGGTVKVVVMSAEPTADLTTLVNTVQTVLDPTQNQGVGMGQAPIGHTVTVAGVITTKVNVTMTLTYKFGYDWAATKAAVDAAVDAYFDELIHSWENTDQLIVRVAQLESRVLQDCSAFITDITSAKLNGSTSNLTLGTDAIPIRGTTNG